MDTPPSLVLRRVAPAAFALLGGLVVASFQLACGPSVPVATLRAARTCHVWRVGPMSSIVVDVVGEHASVGARRRASFVGRDQIVYHGDIGQVRATYYPSRVVVHGLTGAINATITRQRAVVHGALGAITIDFNAACTDRQVGLGVVSLIVLMSR